MADSSVSLPHPGDYFAESWYSLSVVYWRYNWKPVPKMTSAFRVTVIQEGARPTGLVS